MIPFIFSAPSDAASAGAWLFRWSLLAFFASLVAGAIVVGLLQRYSLHDLRQEAALSAGTHARRIQDQLQRALSATFALGAVVRQGGGNVNQFERLAAEMLPFYPGVSNLQLAPDGVVRTIHPLAGNEAAIGHAILDDPRRNREALLARESGQLTLAGPFELVQGGIAVIGRLPVYLPDERGEEHFWGFTNALISIPELLSSARFHDLEAAGFRYALWRADPDSGAPHRFAGTPDALLSDPVEYGFDVPNGRWTLSLEPAAGWIAWGTLWLQVVIAIAFSTVTAALYFLFSRYALGLRRAALERAGALEGLTLRLQEAVRLRELARAEADAAHRQWTEALDAVHMPVFIHDEAFRIVRANRAYLRHAGKPLAQVAGRVYWEVFPPGSGPLPACCDLTRNGGPGPAEDQLGMENGDIYLSHGFPVRGAGGERFFIHLLDDVTREHQAASQLRHLAHHDPLTGLPNRLLFQDRGEQALHLVRRNGKRLAVMLLDLDRFKPVNDLLGHDLGDLLLQAVAERLEGALRRGSDTLARVGGDEFSVLLPELQGEWEPEAVASKLAEALARPFVIEGHSLSIGVSIGIALAPEQGTTLRELMLAADRAMYVAKRAGGGFARCAPGPEPEGGAGVQV